MGKEPKYYKSDNLHVHIIHSERLRQPPIGKWDRNIYFTDKGIQARNKNERAKDKDGNDLPPVHLKGEPKCCFSYKDPEYASGKWLAETKIAVKEMFESLDYVYEPRKYFPRAKEGKGKTHNKDGKLTRYGRIKKEHELFEKAEDLMEFYINTLNYNFPDNAKINGQHTIEFENFRKHLVASLNNGDSLDFILRRHGKKKPQKSESQPEPEATPVITPEVKSPVPTPMPAIVVNDFETEIVQEAGQEESVKRESLLVVPATAKPKMAVSSEVNLDLDSKIAAAAANLVRIEDKKFGKRKELKVPAVNLGDKDKGNNGRGGLGS